MKPGERVRFIQEAAESLLTREWPVAQLTLDQFGFETWEPSNDFNAPDPYSYFISQIKKKDDEQILALHEYLVGGDAISSSSTGPWDAQLPVNMFLSHIHEQREFIGLLKARLARLGVDAFVAHSDIHPSQQWREVIKAALGTCHVFVAFLHPGFHASQWCDQEVGWALGRGIPIVAIRPPGAERRDGFLEEHQDLLLSPATTEWVLADKLLEIVVRDPRTRSLGVRAIAEAFVHSGSFDNTRFLFGLLVNQENIEPEQLRRLEYAIQTNRQVYDAVYGQPGRPVPELLKELIAKHEPPPPPRVTYDDEPF